MESPEPKPAVDFCNRDKRSNQQSNKSCTWRMASHNRHGARPAWSSRQRCCPASAEHAGAGCSAEEQCVAFYDYSRTALMEWNPCVAPGFLTTGLPDGRANLVSFYTWFLGLLRHDCTFFNIVL